MRKMKKSKTGKVLKTLKIEEDQTIKEQEGRVNL